MNSWTTVPLIYLFILLLLPACSGKPSEGDMEQTIAKVLGECGSVIGIENFHKINGRDVDERNYIAQIEYNLVLKEDVNIPSNVIPGNLQGAPACAWNAFFNVFRGKTGVYPAGSKLHVGPLELNYVKTENGWMPR